MLGFFAHIRAASLRLANTFMLVMANTPRPFSKVVAGFVQMGRVFA